MNDFDSETNRTYYRNKDILNNKQVPVPKFEFHIYFESTSGLTDPKNNLTLSRVQLIVAAIRPSWKSLKYKIFKNGITNKIFCVFDANEPLDKIVFRVFGNGTSKLINREQELQNMELLAFHNIAAPLLAIFSNGIVCGYLNGKCININDIRRPHLIELTFRKICETMAHMHRIPCSNSEPFLFSKLSQYFSIIPKEYDDSKKQRVYEEYFVKNDKGLKIIEINLINDVNYIRQRIENLNENYNKLSKKIVFCHNDLLIYNILYDITEDKVHFIDYEYASPNYQLFDIANHFCEYAGVNEPDYTNCPSEQDKMNFLKIYLHHFGEYSMEDDLDCIVSDIRLFEAAAHIFWCVWAIVQSHISTINFDYLKYAIIRHQQYMKIIK